MKNKKYLLAFLVVASLGFSPVGSASFSNIYALGDSLSDIGSSESAVFSIHKLLLGQCDPGHPCPPYFDGRISNGPVANEYLADALIPGGGKKANFSSYAIAGSTTGIGNFGDGGNASAPGKFLIPGMAFQLASYLTSNLDTNSDALHIVWGGANDYLTGDSATDAASNIAKIVETLAAAGAKNILVPNIPDLSLTPFVQLAGSASINSAQGFSVNFNQALADNLDGLKPLFQANNANLFQFDTYSLFNKIIQNSATYGFTNTVDACVGSTTVCSDQNQYVFWDDFHPTTQVHAIFATAMASAVPVPASVFLFAGGLFTLIFQGKVRRQRLCS